MGELHGEVLGAIIPAFNCSLICARNASFRLSGTTLAFCLIGSCDGFIILIFWSISEFGFGVSSARLFAFFLVSNLSLYVVCKILLDCTVLLSQICFRLSLNRWFVLAFPLNWRLGLALWIVSVSNLNIYLGSLYLGVYIFDLWVSRVSLRSFNLSRAFLPIRSVWHVSALIYSTSNFYSPATCIGFGVSWNCDVSVVSISSVIAAKLIDIRGCCDYLFDISVNSHFSSTWENSGTQYGWSFVFGSSRRIFVKAVSFMMVSSAPPSHK